VVDINSKLSNGEKGLKIDHSLKVDKDFGEEDLANEIEDQSSKSIEKEPPILVSRVTLSSGLKYV
jgi:hypothetical protein